jgi:hypothetical protein
LKKEFPHIFLDGHTGDKAGTHRYSIDRSNRISLEGDFDKYFQVFAPNGYKSIALAVLTPDVMQTLVDESERFDVEIFGSHLRIISKKKVYGKPGRERAILESAKKLLAEINHLEKSWSKENSQNARNMLLKLYDDPAIKLRNKYFRLNDILTFLVLMGGAVMFIIDSIIISNKK